jgi:hypothetical protein
MEMRKPINNNIMTYHARNAREIMPLGAGKHKPAKAGRWVVKKPRRDRGVSFSMTGPCKGELSEVMELGLRLARAAKEEGNVEYAKKIVLRMRKIPLEYERNKLLRKIENAKKRLSK